MKRLCWAVLGIILSPELLAVGLSVVVELWWPELFSMLGRKLEADSEIWKYLPTLTLGLAAYSFKLSSNLRAPLQGHANKSLYQWPMYQFFVDRVYIGMGYSVAAALGSLILWMFGKDLDHRFVGLIFVSATTVASATALTMLLAKQKLTELLILYS